MRAERKEKPTAKHELAAFYGTVSRRGFTESENYADHIAKLREWQEALPDSPTPLVVLGMVYLQYAWDARGSGIAATVSDVGWVLFHDRIDLAQEALEAAVSKGVKDGAACAALMTVAKANGVPRSQARAWLDAGRAIDPDYTPMYLGMLDYLLPKWGGEPGEAERFALEIADQIGGDDGLEVYGMLAETLHREDLEALWWGDLDRDKAALSAKVLLDRYPEAQFAIQFAAMVAWARHDVATARSLLPRIKEPDDTFWGRTRFHSFERWCENDQPMGGERARVWGSFYYINSLVFAPNSRYLWCPAGGTAFPVHLIDIQTGKLRQRLLRPGTSVLQFDYSPANRLLAGTTLARDFQGIVVWNVSSGEVSNLIPVNVEFLAIAISPAAPLLAFQHGQAVRLVDLATEETKQTFATGHNEVGEILFSSDGKLLAVRCSTELTVWRVDSGERHYVVEAKSPPRPKEPQVQEALRFDAQSRLICLGVLPSGRAGMLRFSEDGMNFDILLEGHVARPCCISPDGTLMATAGPRMATSGPRMATAGPRRHSQPQPINIWSVSSKSVIQQLPGHAGAIMALAFSADNKLLASASEFGEIKVWDVSSPP